MHCTVRFRAVQVNVTNQNAGIFIGDIRLAGIDSSQKTNSGHASVSGSGNGFIRLVNITQDSGEWVDGTIRDGDHKPVWGHHA
ncbi:MAG: hypothetical protein K6T78_14040 [Alicyclobacillus sp.]|nr:hypothetical protein [Alicyclobacillus sp.]